MHFSIPDLQQFRDDNGIAYTVSFLFDNIIIFKCCLNHKNFTYNYY